MPESLLVLALLLVPGIWIYNRLVGDRNRVRAGWSDIDVQLKRRHDLVPQLVATVKAYAGYEQATLTAVTELRTRSEATTRLPEKAAIEASIESALHKLIVVAEAYPELQADQNFLQLQRDLVAIEDHIQYARRYYNGAVRIFNTRIQSFPHVLVARPLRFKEAEYFELADARERDAVRVALQ
jgi:LemA protein